MQITTKGLILREVKVRESDKILTILTPGQGIISASARGAMRPGNKLFSGTGLFCYSEFTLFEGRTMHRVDEAAPIEVFFGLRQSVEGIALATYIAELVQILQPTGSEAEVLLNLTLNSYHMLAQGKMPPQQVKPVFELRAMTEGGFMPDVVACQECGRYEGGHFRFGPHHGTLLCADCTEEKGREVNIDEAALAALRHIVLSDAKKIFAFTLRGNSLVLLQQASEDFVLCHLEHSPKSLEFLRTVMTRNVE